MCKSTLEKVLKSSYSDNKNENENDESEADELPEAVAQRCS